MNHRYPAPDPPTDPSTWVDYARDPEAWLAAVLESGAFVPCAYQVRIAQELERRGRLDVLDEFAREIER